MADAMTRVDDRETRRRSAGEETTSLGSRHVPLRDQVADRIRRSILAGRLRPGARLVEDSLARDFGVSRNPVREALRALAAEGLVRVTARRGAAVMAFDAGTAAEMVEVRAALEGLNARLAARRRDPALLKRLAEILRRGSDAARAGELGQLTRLNGDFHDALAAAGANQVLRDLMRSLRERTGSVFAPLSGGRAIRTWAEHAAILRAVISGDDDLACSLATRHVLNAGVDSLGNSAAVNGATAAVRAGRAGRRS